MMRPAKSGAFDFYLREHKRCLGEAAREFREAKGMSEAEVAARAKCSVRWLKRLEQNHLDTNFLLRRLDQMAGALGIDLYELYKRAGEMAGPPPWVKPKIEGDDDES